MDRSATDALIKYKMHQRQKRRELIMLAAAKVTALIAQAALQAERDAHRRRAAPRPWHNWHVRAKDVLDRYLDPNAHPEVIHVPLGVTRAQFLALKEALNLADTRECSGNEKLAIFLATCRQGKPVRHVAEQFQRSIDTVHHWFNYVLRQITYSNFRERYIVAPTADSPVPPEIANDPKRFPYFRDCVGAIDGTHVPWFVHDQGDSKRFINRKGYPSQNVLAACTFDLRVCYMMAGYEGSATDSKLMRIALERGHAGVELPAPKYYLGDAGFALSRTCLVPYHKVRYHLQEFAARKDQLPADPKELFNLRHASLRNAIERIFGVMQRRWPIITQPHSYSVETQTLIPIAVAVLQNFIVLHRQSEQDQGREEYEGPDFSGPDVASCNLQRLDIGDPTPEASNSAMSARENREIHKWRDDIAQAMWDDYQTVLVERGLARTLSEHERALQAELRTHFR